MVFYSSRSMIILWANLLHALLIIEAYIRETY